MLRHNLAFASAIAFTMLASPADAQSKRGCQTGQLNTAANYDAPGSMTVQSGGYCNRNLRTSRFDFKEIQFVEMPRHGTLTKNGRFGYRYKAKAGYTGPDSFAIRYIGDQVDRTGQSRVPIYQGIRWSVNVI
jgi:hypothetical protein